MIKDIGKIPPQAVEFEEAILGALLISKNVIDRITILKPNHFYLDQHQEIYAACLDLLNENKPIDILTVSNKLSDKGKLDIVGGQYYLAKITSKVMSAAHLEYHSSIVYEKYCLRELISISANVIERAYNEENPFEIQSTFVSQVESLGNIDISSVKDLNTSASDRLKELDVIQQNKITITGIDTGWDKLNNIIHGWQKTDLIIVAARPGQGKSAFMINAVLNVAAKNIPCGVISLEMSNSQMVDRVISNRTKIGGDFIKTANLSPTEWGIIHKTNFNLPIYIDDKPISSMISLKSKARIMVRKHGIKLLAVDYLQLVQSNEKGMNREQQISSISRGLKLLAKELEIPIIALAQLSREAEKTSGRPLLAHLRESGSIEQDADLVLFPFDPNSDNKEELNPRIELIVAKHRHGSTGIRMFTFRKQTQIFEELNDF